MPRKHIDEFKAGVFVIAALVVLVGLVLWMGAIDVFDQPDSVAYLYSNAADGPQGLMTDSPVSVGDMKIGKIASVQFDQKNQRILYELWITVPGYKLYSDGKAKVVSGLLGGSSIMISDFGNPISGPATSQNPINVTGGMAEIMNNFAVISEQLKQMVVINRDNVDELIDNMVSVSANLNAASKEIRRNPWRLLYKPDEHKMKSLNIYDAARNFDSAATRLNIVATKLKAAEQLDMNDPDSQDQIKYIERELQDTFNKFQEAEQAFWKQLEN